MAEVAGIQVPGKGELAKIFERDETIRRRILEKPDQILTRWVSQRATGIASVAAMRLNSQALTLLAELWTRHCPFPKTVPVDFMRDEAGSVAGGSLSHVLLQFQQHRIEVRLPCLFVRLRS